MTGTLLFVLILIAAELNAWVMATAMVLAMLDAAIVGLVAAYAYVRLGFGE